MIQAIRNRQGTIIDFVHTMANSVAEQTAGRNFIGLKMLEDFPTAKAIGAFDEFVKGVETGSFVDFEHNYKGEEMDSCFRWTAVKFGDGLLVTTEDISARKKVEEQLKEQAHFVTHIADRSPYMIGVLDIASNKIIYINQACERFFGLTNGEMQNMINGLWQQLVVPEDLAIFRVSRQAIHYLINTSMIVTSGICCEELSMFAVINIRCNPSHQGFCHKYTSA